nr:hypothetical protein [Tanacetum cinerariifolium]
MEFFAFIYASDPTKVRIVERERERLFDEGGSGTQMEHGDSARGRPDADIQSVVGAANIVTEDAAPERLRRQGKRKSRFLAEAVLNAEVRVMAIPTLPFVTTSMSTTPEREDEDHTDFVDEPNLRTIEASQRFFISLDSPHNSRPTIVEAEVNYLVRMKHDQLFTEHNVRAARQMYLNVEVRMRARYNVKERRRLQYVLEKQNELLKAKDGEIESLKA